MFGLLLNTWIVRQLGRHLPDTTWDRNQRKMHTSSTAYRVKNGQNHVKLKHRWTTLLLQITEWAPAPRHTFSTGYDNFLFCPPQSLSSGPALNYHKKCGGSSEISSTLTMISICRSVSPNSPSRHRTISRILMHSHIFTKSPLPPHVVDVLVLPTCTSLFLHVLLVQ